MAYTAEAHQHDREKLKELRSFEASLLSHTGPGPTRIIPPSRSQAQPERADDKAERTGELAESAITPTDAGPNVEDVATDLLRGIRDPGPAVTAVARQAAVAMRWAWNYAKSVGDLLDQAAGLSGESILAQMERLTKLRDAEVLVMGRLLLSLEMLRDRELQLEVRVLDRPRRRPARR